MEKLSEWIISIAGISMVATAVLALTPEGAPKKMMRLACGAASVIAVLSIVTRFDFDDYSKYLSRSREEAERVVSQAEEEALVQKRFIIEESCASYILDKGNELGAQISVRVKARWSQEGYWYPAEAEISGSVESSARKSLARYIETELGISEEDQTWSTQDE